MTNTKQEWRPKQGQPQKPEEDRTPLETHADFGESGRTIQQSPRLGKNRSKKMEAMRAEKRNLAQKK